MRVLRFNMAVTKLVRKLNCLCGSMQLGPLQRSLAAYSCRVARQLLHKQPEAWRL